MGRLAMSLNRARTFTRIALSSRSVLVAAVAFRRRTTAQVGFFLSQGGRVSRKRITYGLRSYELDSRAWRALPSLLQHAGFGTEVSVKGRLAQVTLPQGDKFETEFENLHDALGVLAERYVNDEYAWLNVAGAVVIDVGAHIGDSAIYFARRGARVVYAYEPFPALWSQAVRNVQLNGVGEIVRVELFGIGIRRERRLAALTPGSAMSSRTVERASGPAVEVELVPFSQLLAEVLARHPADRIVCKIDCEGAEFEFLDVSVIPIALSKVDQLIVEYHDHEPDRIVDGLQALGFSTAIDSTSSAPRVRGLIKAVRD